MKSSSVVSATAYRKVRPGFEPLPKPLGVFPGSSNQDKRDNEKNTLRVNTKHKYLLAPSYVKYKEGWGSTEVSLIPASFSHFGEICLRNIQNDENFREVNKC